MEYIFYINSAIGILLCLKLSKTKWPNWLGSPLLLLGLLVTHDLGVGPLANIWFDIPFSSFIYTKATFSERIPAIFLIFLTYFTIVSGMIFSKMAWPNKSVFYEEKGNSQIYTQFQISNGWTVSVLFFWIGFIANILVIAYLLPGRSLLGIMSERAVYSDLEVLSATEFHYFRLLSVLMQIGALSMMYFSNGKSWRLKIAITGMVLFIFFQAIYGGRARVIFSVIMMVMAYHYGFKSIKFSQLIKFILLGVSFLLFISFVRFGVGSVSEGLYSLLARILMSHRLDQTALVYYYFPNFVPYTGAINILGSIIRFLPAISIPGTSNMWMAIVNTFYYGNNPFGGIGGENYATAAELYSWNGYWVVILFSFTIGVLFGIVFEWQRRNRNNWFVKLLTIYVWITLFSTESRLADSFGSIIYIFVPIALMASFVNKSKYSKLLQFWLYFEMVAILSYYSFRDTGMTFLVFNFGMLKYAIIGSLPIIYFLSLSVLINSGPLKLKSYDNKKIAEMNTL
ncbi:MAG: O-antigen polymerase [Thermodesulfobacteriota bacterium]